MPPVGECASCAASSNAAASSISFVAFGDWGWDCYDSLHGLAGRINAASTCGDHRCHALQCAIVLGDNFYPDGISSTRDPRVECWGHLFAKEPNAMPWLVVPGNHDYYSSNGIQAQLDLSTDARYNPNHKWCMGSATATGPDALCSCSRNISPSAIQQRATSVVPPPPPLPQPAKRGVRRPPPLKLQPQVSRCPVHEPERLPWAQHTFQIGGSHPPATVDIFMLDTCGTQFSVRNRHPHVLSCAWPKQKEWLRSALSRSSATWKIAAGHHPLFTHGFGHQDEARCLRGNEYTSVNDLNTVHAGMGLLEILHEGGVDVYLSGHEHAFQTARDTCARSGHVLHCVVAGNAMETYYWRGRYNSPTDAEPDTPCLELYRRRKANVHKHSPLAAASGVADGTPTSEEIAALRALMRGERLDVDPQRSVFSCRSHICTEGADNATGVCRLDISATRCIVRHIHDDGHASEEHIIEKSCPA